ncbi:MAG: hypothetical protein PUK64_09675 [bacterium]|nr:hypothetical protein [bacterium]MDD7723239.1 hypothetical protein [bacterium]MDY4103240.1 hypothetical protein [Parabacteroides sp.]
MTEIIVSIENDWAIDSIINAIKMLKGVSSAKMKSVKTDDSNVRTTKKYSQRIERLRQLSGTGITQTDIDNDSRLAYLLNK